MIKYSLISAFGALDHFRFPKKIKKNGIKLKKIYFETNKRNLILFLKNNKEEYTFKIRGKKEIFKQRKFLIFNKDKNKNYQFMNKYMLEKAL